MRNLKKILCLALVLSMVLAVVSGAAYTNYADDAELTIVNEDYLLAAQLLQDIGVVVGVNNPEDGKTYYYPDQLLTRAELARVLYVLYSGTTDGAVYDPDLFRDELSTSFTDISGHWAEGYIKYGQAMGYLNGKSASIFDPDANVKAQEMATALLIVLGYKAADIAPNYPVNVVKYAYTNNAGNLFTTGLSTAAASGGDHGIHVVGLGAALGFNERDIEGEFQLVRELTREEAFYMMYKAITQRSMVSKNLNIGDSVANVDGTYYYNTGVKYVNYKFNVNFSQKKDTDWVAGSNDIAFTGYDKALYNENNVAATIYTGNYGKAGYVYLEKNKLVQDFGYTAATGSAGGSDQGYGFILSATDWNKQIGREISFTLTTWGSKKIITEYAFSYGTGETTKMLSFGGATLSSNKTKKFEVSADGKAVVVGGISYVAYDKVVTGEGDNATTTYYANLITNNGVGEKKTAEEIVAAIYDANKMSPDSVKLYYKDTADPKVKTLYGVIEEENVYAKVTISDEQKEDGKAQLNFISGTPLVIKNTYELADGDRIFGYFDQKTLGQATYDSTAANFKYGLTKLATKYDGMTLVFEKVAATAVENVVTDVVTDANGTKTKYFIEKVDGTEFQLGKASNLTAAYVGNTFNFVPAETSYWALYIVDGYCYEAEKVATVASKDLTVTAVKKDVNTANNKVTYVFTMQDADKNVYTFTKTDDTNKLAQYDNIAKDDTVKYTYDAKTKEAIDVIEYVVLTVEGTELKAEEVFGNKDTTVAEVEDVLAELVKVTAEYIEYRVKLPASGNEAYDKPIVFGTFAQKAEVETAIDSAKEIAEVILPEYTYVFVSEVAKTADEFVDLINNAASGDVITLGADVEIEEGYVKIAAGKDVVINLNNNTLSATNNKTATFPVFLDVNGGTLTVIGGTVAYEHTGTNMGWSGGTGVFNVTAGGVLNLENVTVSNLGGTDMNFAVHLNNWGEVTLIADNCVFEGTYCGVRVFNSGPNNNNVTIENSTVKGATRAFWVHNYVSSDFGGKLYSSASAAYDEAAVLARLNLDIYNNNNAFELTGTAKSPIRYGFNSAIYYNEAGEIVE